jgi:hypothetical protein
MRDGIFEDGSDVRAESVHGLSSVRVWRTGDPLARFHQCQAVDSAEDRLFWNAVNGDAKICGTQNYQTKSGGESEQSLTSDV